MCIRDKISDAGASLNYGHLTSLTDSMAVALPEKARRQLGFIALAPTPALVAVYLHALRSTRHVPLLLPPDLHTDLLASLARNYQPDWIALPGNHRGAAGYAPYWAADDGKILVRTGRTLSDPELYPDLALLLTTSGSTGSNKLVRLSYEALAENAIAISKYLNLDANDRVLRPPLAKV